MILSVVVVLVVFSDVDVLWIGVFFVSVMFKYMWSS